MIYLPIQLAGNNPVKCFSDGLPRVISCLFKRLMVALPDADRR